MTMLIDMYHWAMAHWVLVIGALITVLNAATSVWHDHPKAIRWFTFFISVFSAVRSKGADPGVLGALKIPGLPELRSKSAKTKTIASGTLVLMLLCVSGCKTTSAGEHVFDPATALSTACAAEPAVNMLAVVGACNNLKEPAKTTCLKIANIVHTMAPLALAGIGAIYDVCRGIEPRALPKSDGLNK